MTAGRSCPLSYRYSADVFNRPAAFQADALYVVGGLYGNEQALATVLALFEAEPARHKRLLFNGDFNWFNIEPGAFERINRTVLNFDAIRGNVETELAAQAGAGEGGDDAGCGCGYPEWVGDGVVERSNTIMRRLAATAAGFADLRRRMGELPMHARVDVGGVGVGVVHGDAESLAGWGFAPEHLAEPAALTQAARWFDAAGVRIFACSHTCTPVLAPVANRHGEMCLIANNGAAGMPNFSNLAGGLMTRIALEPCTHARPVYAQRLGPLHVEAIGIPYDAARWQERFLAQWPEGSPAYLSYWERIRNGTGYRKEQACVGVG